MSENGISELPATELVYYRDAYARELDAMVVGVNPETHAIALDRTIVYAGGGGQPYDLGTVSTANGSWMIASMKKQGNVVWHSLEGDVSPPAVGEQVHLSLDWKRRYRLMRMHSALHVLCGMVYRDYGALVTGGNMGPDRARMDFVILTDLSPAGHISLSHDARSPFDFNRTFDDDIGTDFNVGVNFRPRVDHSCRMNAHDKLVRRLVFLLVFFVVVPKRGFELSSRNTKSLLGPGAEIDQLATFRTKRSV